MNPAQVGAQAAALYRLEVPPGGEVFLASAWRRGRASPLRRALWDQQFVPPHPFGGGEGESGRRISESFASSVSERRDAGLPLPRRGGEGRGEGGEGLRAAAASHLCKCACQRTSHRSTLELPTRS